jgi:hypothetical protein
MPVLSISQDGIYTDAQWDKLSIVKVNILYQLTSVLIPDYATFSF